MDGIRKLRKGQRWRAKRETGVTGIFIGIAAECQGRFHRAEITAAPVDTTEGQPIQDPVTGQPYFMLGVSPLGVDPLAPMD